jgi:hypothetical protein
MTRREFPSGRIGRAAAAAICVLLTAAALSGAATASTDTLNNSGVQLVRISSDPFTGTGSQHATEDDPDTYAYGSTVVATFQQGLYADAIGATGIGFATSHDHGRAWSHGSLPGITTATGGRYSRAALPSVGYDRKHHTWLIATIAGLCATTDCTSLPLTMAVLVSRSTNGGKTWSEPVTVARSHTPVTVDRPEIRCDTHPASPYYGHCYLEYERHNNAGGNKHVLISVSTDGARTWGAPQGSANHTTGGGAGTGAPLVQPDGTVVVPTTCWTPAPRSCNDTLVFASTNGGRTWGAAHIVARTKTAADPLSRISGGSVFSAAVDGTGLLYLAWADCRFRPACTANDIVMTTSTNGRTWSPVIRVTTGPGDHILPGIGASPLSGGPRARIGITYYTIPHPHCTPATCLIDTSFISSVGGRANWSHPVRLAGPFRAPWLPKTPGGVMLSDWLATAVLPGGTAISAFPLASKPTGTTFHQDMYAVAGGAPIPGRLCRPPCHWAIRRRRSRRYQSRADRFSWAVRKPRTAVLNSSGTSTWGR